VIITPTSKNKEEIFWDKFVVVESYDNMSNNNGSLYIVYDKDTKVEYYIFYAYSQAGISPIYNADGTIKIYEGE
jgi:hypothetical protein